MAADGINSVVRRALVPDGPPARYAGYTAYRGIAPAGILDTGGETWGRSQRFGYVQMVDGRAYWYATVNVAEGASAAATAHADVLRLFGEWHDPIPALLAQTPTNAVLVNDLYDLALPLASFNAGVEMGQIAVAALVVPLFWKLQTGPRSRLQFASVCSALVVIAGSYWLVERMVSPAGF